MSAKLKNGTYYEIVGGMNEDIVVNINNTSMSDKDATMEAANTERCAYKNTYKKGKRIESVKLYDPYNDEYFPINTDRVYYEPLPRDKAFEYSMLGRLQSDCEYFLGNGNGYEGHLWAHTVEAQIKEMRDRWNAFEDDEKPEWLTMEQIDEYEKLMLDRREKIEA